MSIVFLVQNLAQKSDSVGYDCLFQYHILREYFGASEDIRIYADVFDRDLHPGVPIFPMSDFWVYIAENPSSHIIYHFCDGWEHVDDYLRETAKHAIVRWHNNTPPWLYANANIDFAEGCNRGFEVIAKMARAGTVRFLVNSEFTRRQLHALDGTDALIDTVFPGSTFLLKQHATTPAQNLAPAASDAINLLFVGRVVPHKGHRHILSVAATVQRFSGKRVRVVFVGGVEQRLEAYRTELEYISTRFGIELIFTGTVTDDELSRIYRSCDAFICMSEHEGFGMPVFEAMREGVPVVVWTSSAMTDLLAGHPLASNDFNIARLAACVLVSLDRAVRQRVVALQENLLKQYTRNSVKEQLLHAIYRARGEQRKPYSKDNVTREAVIEEIEILVNDLAHWVEHEVGSSVETFVHDATINYMSLYDIDVHKRLIEYIRSGAIRIVRNDALGDVGNLQELHGKHDVIRAVMSTGHTRETGPAANLDELLSYDDDVFVRVACRTLLSREADPGFLSAYLKRLRSGEGKAALLNELARSAEGRSSGNSLSGLKEVKRKGMASLANVESAVVRLSRYLIPDVAAPSPYHPMGSVHHVDDLLRMNDIAFVDNSFQILFGRSADPRELEHYIGTLCQGTPRQTILAELAGTEDGRKRAAHLDGLAEFLSETGRHDETFLPTSLARLENDLGRLTNFLVAQRSAPSPSSAKPESSDSLLRLTSAALESARRSISSAAEYSVPASENGAIASNASDVEPEPGETLYEYIHQIFISSNGQLPNEFPESVRHNIDSVRRCHPEAHYHIWGGDELRVMISRHFDKDVVRAFDSLQAFALKADLARYCLLYIYGGLYSDLSNRFVARWRIGANKSVACFRDHKPIHGAVWMNQNTIIYALPRQPEIKLAIDLVVENVRNREYGVSSLAPSGPVLFGRVFAALGRANVYQIGDAINLQVEGELNRSCYVDEDGSIVAVRLQGGGGKPSEIGLRGTNVYGEMWDRRAIYGEGLMYFAHDYTEVVTNLPRDEHGIRFPGMSAGSIRLATPELPRGLYTGTWRFAAGADGTLKIRVRSRPSNELLHRVDRVSLDPSGSVTLKIPIERSSDLELEIQGNGISNGVFKDFTIKRLSANPADDIPIGDAPEKNVIPKAGGNIVSDTAYIHHILYSDLELAPDEASYVAENIRIARELHPSARQLIWTPSSLREIIAAQFSPGVVTAFDRLQSEGNRSELARYCLLFSMGGLYVDPWLRMVNPVNSPHNKTLACFRSAKAEQGASWSVDTGLIYAIPGCTEIGLLIEQIAESTIVAALGVSASSVTGAERLGRLLATSYDAASYFGGEIVSVSSGPQASSDAFLSQDGRLIAIRKGPGGPAERDRERIVLAWHSGQIYHAQ